MSQSIHQEITCKATPEAIYTALTNTEQFKVLTGGAPTEISREAGGAFSCFGGMIEGRNIELVPGQRIVQAWRVKNWEPGVYSIAKFELKAENADTRLVFDHTGFPEEHREHLEKGWHDNYWGPLNKYISQN